MQIARSGLISASAHNLHELFGYDQSETRPAVFPGDRAIHLAECFKQILHLFFRYSDPGIRDRKLNFHFVIERRDPFDSQRDSSVIREFNGVIDQVVDDLSQTVWITEYVQGYISRKGIVQFQSFGIFLPLLLT